MYLSIPEPWLLFCIGFGAMLLATFLMNRQSRHFRTMDPVMVKFTIMDLEFPSKVGERTNITGGIYKLEHDEARACVNALRRQLITDFLVFMPGTYGAIFILCMHVAGKSGQVGDFLFTALAMGQILCFVLDTIENIYLWSIVKPQVKPESNTAFYAMKSLEYVKWSFALLGGIGGLSAIAWSWLTGDYAAHSLLYIGIFFAEVIVFAIATVLSKRKVKI